MLHLILGNYLDHLEPQIAALSFTLLSGGDIYPALEANEPLYGLVYGPFLFVAIPLYLDESFLGSKLLSSVLLCMALVLCSRISSLTSGNRFSAHSLFLLAALLMLKEAIMFSNRVEPFLLLSSSIALYGLLRFALKTPHLSLGLLRQWRYLSRHMVFFILRSSQLCLSNRCLRYRSLSAFASLALALQLY